MLSSSSILVVSGEPAHQEWLAASASKIGLRPVCCETQKSAVELLGRHSFSMIFCDDSLPGGSFQYVIDSVARCGTPIPVIVTSRRDEWGLFLKALNSGAFDYIALPPSPGEVERIACAALMERRVSPRVTETQQRLTTQSAA
jgi:DNA-binding NtrC family response regulator